MKEKIDISSNLGNLFQSSSLYHKLRISFLLEHPEYCQTLVVGQYTICMEAVAFHLLNSYLACPSYNVLRCFCSLFGNDFLGSPTQAETSLICIENALWMIYQSCFVLIGVLKLKQVYIEKKTSLYLLCDDYVLSIADGTCVSTFLPGALLGPEDVSVSLIAV